MVAASGLIRRVRAKPSLAPWLARLLARMPAKKAAVALANKLARVAWALLAHGGIYQASQHAAAA